MKNIVDSLQNIEIDGDFVTFPSGKKFIVEMKGVNGIPAFNPFIDNAGKGDNPSYDELEAHLGHSLSTAYAAILMHCVSNLNNSEDGKINKYFKVPVLKKDIKNMKKVIQLASDRGSLISLKAFVDKGVYKLLVTNYILNDIVNELDSIKNKDEFKRMVNRPISNGIVFEVGPDITHYERACALFEGYNKIVRKWKRLNKECSEAKKFIPKELPDFKNYYSKNAIINEIDPYVTNTVEEPEVVETTNEVLKDVDNILASLRSKRTQTQNTNKGEKVIDLNNINNNGNANSGVYRDDDGFVKPVNTINRQEQQQSRPQQQQQQQARPQQSNGSIITIGGVQIRKAHDTYREPPVEEPRGYGNRGINVDVFTKGVANAYQSRSNDDYLDGGYRGPGRQAPRFRDGDKVNVDFTPAVLKDGILFIKRIPLCLEADIEAFVKANSVAVFERDCFITADGIIVDETGRIYDYDRESNLFADAAEALLSTFEGNSGYGRGGYGQGGGRPAYGRGRSQSRYDRGGYGRDDYDRGGYDRGGYGQGGGRPAYGRGNQSGYGRGGYDRGGYDRGYRSSGGGFHSRHRR